MENEKKVKKEKKYKIISYPTTYSKKKGSVKKSVCVEKDLSFDDAIRISIQEYGNTHGKIEWRTSGLIYPTEWKIK